jgi:SAM-dependent methyltransferase
VTTRGAKVPRARARPSDPAPSGTPERYIRADPYRVEREWQRYEGTPQRDLFRTLRERFITRHAAIASWCIDLGSGPGRFTRTLGQRADRTVALDISGIALRTLGEKWSRASAGLPLPDRVRGDASHPPFPDGSSGLVALLGNTLGFTGSRADELLASAAGLVRPGGRLLLEIAPGPGEASRYLARLPVGSVGRLFAAPPAALLPRIEREGFRVEPRRKSREGPFRRFDVAGVRSILRPKDWTALEISAVAPALGPQAARIEAIRSDERAWEHLLVVEEELGRRDARWTSAAALLLALQKTTGPSA